MDIFAFSDYREYLKAYYAEQKSKKPQFSYRFFARLAGLGSASYLRMVIDGERNISPVTINKFARAIKLSKEERIYFETLVLYTQTKSDSEKEYYFDLMSDLKTVLGKKPETEIKINFPLSVSEKVLEILEKYQNEIKNLASQPSEDKTGVISLQIFK